MRPRDVSRRFSNQRRNLQLLAGTGRRCAGDRTLIAWTAHRWGVLDRCFIVVIANSGRNA